MAKSSLRFSPEIPAPFRPRQKGLEYFVQSAARIHEVVPQARFWIAGDGMLRGELAALIQRLGLLDTVTLLGGQDDIAGIMAASDVFVLPSLSESLGNVLLEAMALGKPLVLASDGPLEELPGKIVPPRDHVALAEAIALLCRDGRARRELAELGRERWRQRHTPEVVAAQHDALYVELC